MARVQKGPRSGHDPRMQGIKEGYSGIGPNNTALEVDVFSTNWQSPLDVRNPKDIGPDPMGLEGATEPMTMGQPENPLQINGPEFDSGRTLEKNRNDTGYGRGPERMERVAKRGKS